MRNSQHSVPWGRARPGVLEEQGGGLGKLEYGGEGRKKGRGKNREKTGQVVVKSWATKKNLDFYWEGSGSPCGV